MAYLDGDATKRIHIHEYEEKLHKGKLMCQDGHHVNAKRGTKVVWHYAHVNGQHDECSREMGPWHRWWQDRVEADFLEVIIKRDGKKHIADMINGDDLVVEFQKSVVSPDVIKEREVFYNRMIWVFCCVDHKMKEIARSGRYMHLKLVGGSKFFLCATKRSFIDFDRRGVLEVIQILKATKSEPELYVRIWGMKEFDDTFMKGCLRADAPGRIDRQPYVGLDGDLEDDLEARENALKAFQKTRKVKSKPKQVPGCGKSDPKTPEFTARVAK